VELKMPDIAVRFAERLTECVARLEVLAAMWEDERLEVECRRLTAQLHREVRS
jgi:hypothetical protein